MTTSTGRRGFVGVDRRWLADERLSDSALRLMLWLDSHSDQYLMALSLSRTADEIGWSRNRVKRTIEDLESLGLVKTEQLPRMGGGTRTQITLDLSLWSDGGGPSRTSDDGPSRTSAVVHREARAVVHRGAPTTSTPNVVGTNSQDDSSSVSASRLPMPAVAEADKFTEFWTTYGNLAGTGRRKAIECWNRAMKRGDDPVKIIGGLRAWVAYWRSPDASKAMFAQGFLNQQKWATPPPPMRTTRREGPGMNAVREGMAKARATRSAIAEGTPTAPPSLRPSTTGCDDDR